jgi:hypothetical protein
LEIHATLTQSFKYWWVYLNSNSAIWRMQKLIWLLAGSGLPIATCVKCLNLQPVYIRVIFLRKSWQRKCTQAKTKTSSRKISFIRMESDPRVWKCCLERGTKSLLLVSSKIQGSICSISLRSFRKQRKLFRALTILQKPLNLNSRPDFSVHNVTV